MNKLEIDKTYRLRQRGQKDARWFTFKPRVFVESQQAWWGKSSSDHDLVVFAREIEQFEVEEYAEGTVSSSCDCGALKARTTHAMWCSTQGSAHAVSRPGEAAGHRGW